MHVGDLLGAFTPSFMTQKETDVKRYIVKPASCGC